MGIFGEHRVELICQQCGKSFSTPKSKADKGAKYCSAECYELTRGTKILQRCPTCGKEFELRPSDFYDGRGKYCSRECGFEGRTKRVAVTCQECGIAFETIPAVINIGKGKYCSKECANRAAGKKRRREFEKYVCELCGKSFESKLTPAQLSDGNPRYCGRKCFAQARMRRVERVCEFCEKTFEVTLSQFEEGKGRYCSKTCFDKARINRIAFVCQQCGKQFDLEPSRVEDGRGKFCSKKCSMRYKGETSIEQLMRLELESRHEPYVPQAQFKRFFVDFVLYRRKAVIECDGKYWHSFLNVIARDRRKDEYLKSLGFQVFRFSDQEIRNSPIQCLNQVLAAAPVVSSMVE